MKIRFLVFEFIANVQTDIILDIDISIKLIIQKNNKQCSEINVVEV